MLKNKLKELLEQKNDDLEELDFEVLKDDQAYSLIGGCENLRKCGVFNGDCANLKRCRRFSEQ